MTNRILGVDFGEARTGIAVSDTLGYMANGIGLISSGYIVETAKRVAEKATEYDVCLIVIGYPINMNGTLGPRSERVQEFGKLLGEHVNIPIKYFDERCTTMAANRILNHTNLKSKKRKSIIDTLSAQIILQNYMDYEKSKNTI